MFCTKENYAEMFVISIILRFNLLKVGHGTPKLLNENTLK